MMYVPEFVALYEIEPYIILTLDNETIRVAVKDYLEAVSYTHLTLPTKA